MDVGPRVHLGGLRLLSGPQRGRKGRLQLRRISAGQCLSRIAAFPPDLEGHSQAPDAVETPTLALGGISPSARCRRHTRLGLRCRQPGLAQTFHKYRENLRLEKRRICLVLGDRQPGLTDEQPLEPIAGLLDATKLCVNDTFVRIIAISRGCSRNDRSAHSMAFSYRSA